MSRGPRRLFRIGLTGGIATGKSQVLGRLSAAGLATLDLDRVAHGIIAPGGAGYAPVVEAFGGRILGAAGAIDRKVLGAIVFAAPEARARLDAIVHPLVRAQEAEVARAAEAAGATALVTDAALLVETGQHLRFDRLLVTWCPPETQRARLAGRDGLSAAAVEARLGAQMPVDEKRAFADVVIDTSEAMEETEAQVDALLPGLRAARPAPPLALPLDRALAGLERGPRSGPRGLDPARVIGACAEAGGLDLAALARRLDPPAEGPWYRAARPDAGEPGPESLAACIAVCCAARGADEAAVLAAAFSLARLTHRAAAAAAGAGLAALAAWAVARSGDLAALDERSGAAWSAAARARADGPVPESVVAAVRRAADGTGEPGTLSGALIGLAAGGGDVHSPLGRAVAGLLAG